MFEVTADLLKEVLDSFCHELRNSQYTFSYWVRRKRAGNFYQVRIKVTSRTGKVLFKTGFSIFKNDRDHFNFILAYLDTLESHYTKNASDSDSDGDSNDSN